MEYHNNIKISEAVMLSILGKLLCKELGENKYDLYFSHYSSYIKELSECNSVPPGHNEEIFIDIYEQLKIKDIYDLQQMLERLLSAIELTVKISRQYMLVWLATVITIIVLIASPVSAFFTVMGICTVITCFGYKSIVYIVNRYCFIDANIILLYKTALFHIILTYGKKT